MISSAYLHSSDLSYVGVNFVYERNGWLGCPFEAHGFYLENIIGMAYFYSTQI